MNADLAHEHEGTSDVLQLTAKERLVHVTRRHWIGYGLAQSILAKLSELVETEPGQIRPKNALLIGPTNNGKTTLATRFCAKFPQHCSPDGEYEIIPVIMLQMPPKPTIPRVYEEILNALGAPVGYSGRGDKRANLTRDLLNKVETRMLILDEFHNLLNADTNRQRELLGLVRFLGNELRIPIVALGTSEAYLAIRSDEQLENRFHPINLPVWKNDLEFARLLCSFETLLPLRDESGLSDTALRTLIWEMTEGTIGEVCLLLQAATRQALLNGQEMIDPATIEQCGYLGPRDRRLAFERDFKA